MAREFGSARQLDRSAVKRFFDGRVPRIEAVSPINAVLYQDANPALAEERSRYEIATALPLMAPQSGGDVLDLGCGVGRWALAVAPACRSYLGLDFAEGFLDAGRKATATLDRPERFSFALADLSDGEIPTAAPVDLVIAAGILIYLNDGAVERLIDGVVRLMKPGGKAYLREPMGLTERLTLDRHFSTELSADYSAIYRSRAELMATIERVAGSRAAVTLQAPLYPPDLNNRAETRQELVILESPR
jgi:SAM-dependent methyltransferase